MDFSFIDIQWHIVQANLLHIGIAFVLALPIGWNRERSGTESAGLRTFPIVCIASCAFTLVGMQVFEGSDAEARIVYGIITGIGFIGGGAILKDGFHVAGTATAASIWNTGAIGVAVAYNKFEIAIVLSLINFLILQFATPFKDSAPEEHSKQD